MYKTHLKLETYQSRQRKLQQHWESDNSQGKVEKWTTVINVESKPNTHSGATQLRSEQLKPKHNASELKPGCGGVDTD